MPDLLQSSVIVHEMESKKSVLGSGGWIKHNIDFKSTEGIFFLEKYDELPASVAFGQKLRYFADQNGPKRDHMKVNFEYI